MCRTLPLWQSHQQLNEPAVLAYVRESRWLCWRIGGNAESWCWCLGGGGRPWHSQLLWLSGRTGLKKKGGWGVIYCSQEKDPQVKPMTFQVSWDGWHLEQREIEESTYPPSILWTTGHLTNRASNHDQPKHTEITAGCTTGVGNHLSFENDNPSIHVPYAANCIFFTLRRSWRKEGGLGVKML